jgi:hypothetical protein
MCLFEQVVYPLGLQVSTIGCVLLVMRRDTNILFPKLSVLLTNTPLKHTQPQLIFCFCQSTGLLSNP